jgi:hypothetical protein
LWSSGITKELVTQAAQCHLRSEILTVTREECKLCQMNSALSLYTRLFNPKSSGEGDNANLIGGKHQIESHTTTDLEDIIKIATDIFHHESKLNFKNFYLSLKDEHANMSMFFDSVSNQIKAYDEIETSKMRKAIRYSIHYNPYSHVQNNQALNLQNSNGLDLIYAHHQNAKSQKEQELKKKVNQIIYLENLAKTYNMADGEENKDECPICGMKNNLIFKRFIFYFFTKILKENAWV